MDELNSESMSKIKVQMKAEWGKGKARHWTNRNLKKEQLSHVWRRANGPVQLSPPEDPDHVRFAHF
jgi:hypothetical protein